MKAIGSQTLLMTLILCLSLGLAPFYPEPHLFGKIRWVAGGAQDMHVMDYFDLLLHGIPWLIFIVMVIVKLTSKYR